MCGITGWVSFDRDISQYKNELEAMTETQTYRGPDAGGIWIDRHVGLGHRRLSIIDLEGGIQPMSVPTPDGVVTIIYSGEVYNFVELRNELVQRGHQFRTRSDTEVVLYGYIEWGERVSERLNGMFAFALWDGRIDKLIMVRDRMGIKPLYYFPTTDGVLFGSEPKAILANSLADCAIDLDGLRGLLSFTHKPGSSVWCGMHEVVPGSVITVDCNGLREYPYWTLKYLPHTDDQQTTVEYVRYLLEDIVHRQLVADVPCCSLLSGGLDSSVITALCSAQLSKKGEQVRSFSVDYVGQTANFVADEIQGTPDAPYAREVAEYLNSLHNEVLLNHAAMADPEVRRKVIIARDSPLSLGDKDMSLYLLCQAIREHSTVALSGESADELFGGYSWMHQPEVQAANTFPWMAVFLTGAKAQVSDRLNPELTSALDLHNYVNSEYASATAEVEKIKGEGEHERRMRVISYLHLTRFVKMLLERKDRLSMAVGLEVRVPFCDHRLVEYVYNVPWSLKTLGNEPKGLLRAVAEDLLPNNVLHRVKSPYPSTQSPEYAQALINQARDLVSSNNEVLDLVDRSWLTNVVKKDWQTIDLATRNGIERALDLSIWLDLYRPQLRLS